MSVYFIVILAAMIGYGFGNWAGKHRPLKHPTVFVMIFVFVVLTLASVARFLFE